MKNTDLFLFFSSGKTFKMESSGFVCYFWQKKKKRLEFRIKNQNTLLERSFRNLFKIIERKKLPKNQL